MKNKLGIALIALGIILITMLFLSDKKLEKAPEEELPVVKVDVEDLKPLPATNFNWTPLNDRTEQPAPLPRIEFNELER